MRSVSRFLAAVLLLPLLGFGCKVPDAATKAASKPFTLQFWGVFDDSDAYATVIKNYRALHSSIRVEYRKLRPDEYERELINALAEDRGPDIFMVHNTSLAANLPKIAPLPPTITLPVISVEGSLKKEVIVRLVTNPSITASVMRKQFADVVAADAIVSTLADERTGAYADRIYVITLALDTLALYTNRDLLNAAGLPEPPKNWREFQMAVTKLTKLDEKGNILQSGAALGTGRNVERSSDLLAAIMMQNGTTMLDEGGGVAFNRRPPNIDSEFPPGLDAVRFYTEFANPSKETYTWNAAQPNSLEAFATGKTAMFFGYAFHAAQISALAPKINFDVSPLPQIEGNPIANVANYWLLAASKKSPHASAAWDFIQFAARADQVEPYLAVTGKPTALRALIKKQLDDPKVATFASQVLTARNWYRGAHVADAELALHNLIDDILGGKLEQPLQALELAAQKVNQTIR